MRTALTVAALSLFLAGAPAFLGEHAIAGENGEAKKEQKDPNRKVCKRVRVTGSRIKEKICRRQKDWDYIAEESQETLRQQRDSRSMTAGGGDG